MGFIVFDFEQVFSGKNVFSMISNTLDAKVWAKASNILQRNSLGAFSMSDFMPSREFLKSREYRQIFLVKVVSNY